MNILIIEDEFFAAKRLLKLLAEHLPEGKILGVLDSIEESVEWFQKHEMPDLIFMDIQLADGLSFEIFNQVKVTAPVIFTTAFDQYTLKAFKVHSIDYLLKPIVPKELGEAIDKFKTHYQQKDRLPIEWGELLTVFNKEKKYKNRFLIKQGNSFNQLRIEEVAYFFSEDGVTFIMHKKGKRFVIDQTLDQLQECLNPEIFFRINRKQLIHLEAIQKIHTYFNHRLKLELMPSASDEVIVSRDRAKSFKAWMGQ